MGWRILFMLTQPFSTEYLTSPEYRSTAVISAISGWDGHQSQAGDLPDRDRVRAKVQTNKRLHQSYPLFRMRSLQPRNEVALCNDPRSESKWSGRKSEAAPSIGNVLANTCEERKKEGGPNAEREIPRTQNSVGGSIR